MNQIKKLTLCNIKKGLRYLKKYGIKETYTHISKRYQNLDKEYEQWCQYHKLQKNEIEMQRNYCFAYEPLISILVPVYNTPLSFLKEMIISVCNQTYNNWELCIANASLDNRKIAELLSEYAMKDKRIRVVNIQRNLGISENTNVILYEAKGEYIGLLDHDDVLSINALYEVVRYLNEKNMPEVLYSDEDKITKNMDEHFQPHFKPDFNLDLLRSNNYICHFFVVKKSLMIEIGGFRKEYDGAQDYDLILRCIEKTDKITHIPKILYHWRIHETSTADRPDSKMYAYEAGRRAILDHLERCGDEGDVEVTENMGFYRIKYKIKGKPLISVIILDDSNVRFKKKCMKSIQKTRYNNFEFFVINRNFEKKMVLGNTTFINWKNDSNLSKMINSVVKCTKGKYLLLISSNMKLINKRCIKELLANCQRKNVGIVGAKSYSLNRKIHHAGIIIGRGAFSEKIFENMPKQWVGYMHRDSIQQNLSAVSLECMMVKRQVFEVIEGFDETVGNTFSAIDFCLRAWGKGYLTVYNPYAELYYMVRNGKKDIYSKTEIIYMRERWKILLEEGDPAYNPNMASNYNLKL